MTGMNVGEKIAQELRGPLHLRFVIQPLLAILLAFRDGRNDARAGREPYLFGLLTGRHDRKEMIEAGFKAIALPIVVALTMDAIVQSLLWQQVHLASMITVALLLVATPYICVRGLSNRMVARRVH
jgi:hypothetical protein